MPARPAGTGPEASDGGRVSRAARGGADRARIIRTSFAVSAAALACAVIFVMYGPWKKLSDLYITTAMHTSDHRWLAEAFYSPEYIEEVLGRNGTKQPEGISVGDYENGGYNNSNNVGAGEEGTDADGLRLIRLGGSDAKGWLIIVPDSENLRFVFSNNAAEGDLLEGLASGCGAKAAINAGGYRSRSERGINWGIAVSGGKAAGSDPGRWDDDGSLHAFAALDYENRLYFGRQTAKEILGSGYRDVIEFGPLLLLDGERAEISGAGGGLAPRTALGQTADGKVLMLVLEGRTLGSIGASYRDVQDIMLKYGAVNALNLDGGFSSAMYYNGRLTADPAGSSAERMVPSAVIVL